MVGRSHLDYQSTAPQHPRVSILLAEILGTKSREHRNFDGSAQRRQAQEHIIRQKESTYMCSIMHQAQMLHFRPILSATGPPRSAPIRVPMESQCYQKTSLNNRDNTYQSNNETRADITEVIALAVRSFLSKAALKLCHSLFRRVINNLPKLQYSQRKAQTTYQESRNLSCIVAKDEASHRDLRD